VSTVDRSFGYLPSLGLNFDVSSLICRGAVNDMAQYQKSFGLNGKGSSTGIVFMIYNVCLLHDQ